MTSAWEQLEAAGVPLGAIRPQQVDVDLSTLQDALGIVTRTLTPEQREPLAAWLSGFHHHWPLRFDRVLGTAGARALVHLRSQPLDQGRYLKLRRIAVENLSRLRE